MIPNLVETVKAFAAQEKNVLLGVTEARSKVGSIQVSPEMVNDPAALAQFDAAQGELSSALSRLLVVVENYPQLKSDANFRDLQAQLAQQRADDVLSLSAFQRLEELTRQADSLWPPHPEHLEAYGRWLAEAAELVADAAVLGDRNAALQALLIDEMAIWPNKARDMLEELLGASKDLLPHFF